MSNTLIKIDNYEGWTEKNLLSFLDGINADLLDKASGISMQHPFELACELLLLAHQIFQRFAYLGGVYRIEGLFAEIDDLLEDSESVADCILARDQVADNKLLS